MIWYLIDDNKIIMQYRVLIGSMEGNSVIIYNLDYADEEVLIEFRTKVWMNSGDEYSSYSKEG